ncbi:DUF6920 family protein [Chroogloeocystis siderophila]|uniref:Uncharacterized protein n=1 Tax=Chroogloeocystis siderophila 5.2 s.c.1 TaxID=247279 RepID=A0A1U7HHU6_9CHRO|nr:DUF6544 family protein [Chroogloeocystis siderophila]OKH23163.1 hypothetical protein NIES1031_18915 [Chroogloeocystis siderophila 5.2 s.c.1]
MLTTVYLSIGALGAIAFVVATLQLRQKQQLNQIWQSLETQPEGKYFTQEMIATLPAPVQRYFLHAITPGTPLATSVRLKMSGSLRMGQDQPWLPMQAEEIISVKGFVWQATIGHGLLQFKGADSYANGIARVQFALWGLLPLINAHNPNITRSSMGRLVAEYIWLPSVLLPQNGVTWQAIDENTIQASLKANGEPVTLTLTIDTNGKPIKLSFPRWSDLAKDIDWTYIPMGGEFPAEHNFGGYTIPSQVILGYWFGTDQYYESFHGTLEQVEFLGISKEVPSYQMTTSPIL